MTDEQHEARGSLTDAEREVLYSLETRESTGPKITSVVDHYLTIQADLEAVYSDRLRSGELEKIWQALGTLHTWLEEGQGGRVQRAD